MSDPLKLYVSWHSEMPPEPADLVSGEGYARVMTDPIERVRELQAKISAIEKLCEGDADGFITLGDGTAEYGQARFVLVRSIHNVLGAPERVDDADLRTAIRAILDSDEIRSGDDYSDALRALLSASF